MLDFPVLLLDGDQLSHDLDKRCSKANSFNSKSKREKIWKAIFPRSALLFGAERLFYNLC
ncbi:MAG: hypothetical protein E7153_12015 [Enterococcus faecium]|nr:hypothetical protein [Enterococcus faecium]MBO1086203.1 hypothetical protein [Enterococcus mundtii]